MHRLEADDMFVKKGQVLMRIDPAHYRVAVEQAEAAVAARKAQWQMRRSDAARRADMDILVVSKENRENATSARFAEFSISSTDIKMIITLRRVKTPTAPIANRIALSRT